MPIINGRAIQSEHIWDQACKLIVKRGNPLFGYQIEQLDSGVNFFILALEELGAKTLFSCEGHPHGFYVSFEAPHQLAREINIANPLTCYVQLDGPDLNVDSELRWSVRCRNMVYTEHNKEEILRRLTFKWLEYFGPRLARTRKAIAISRLILV